MDERNLQIALDKANYNAKEAKEQVDKLGSEIRKTHEKRGELYRHFSAKYRDLYGYCGELEDKITKLQDEAKQRDQDFITSIEGERKKRNKIIKIVVAGVGLFEAISKIIMLWN